MKRGTILWVLFSLIVLASLAQAEETLVACGDVGYPPFTWKEGDKIIGVFPELVEMIFGKFGIQVNSRDAGNWNRCQMKVKYGDMDMLMAGYKTEERKEYAIYPETPVCEDPTSIFVWKDRTFPYDTWDDLKGKRVGEMLGSTEGEEIDEFLAKYTTVDYVSTRLQNFKKLEHDRIDFTIIGLYPGRILVKRYGYEEKIISLEKPLRTENLYFALSKKSKFLTYLPQVDAELQKLREDGTIEKLIDKYIDYYIATQGSKIEE